MTPATRTETPRRVPTFFTACLISVLAAGIVACSGAGGRHAESPEEAIRLYLDAMEAGDRRALKSVWWVSNGPLLVDEIIQVTMDSSEAMGEFHERLREVYADELEELETSGRIKLREPGEPPTDEAIRKAVEQPVEEEAGPRMTVLLDGPGFLHVGKHGEHWYVEHGFIAVDREWESKDSELHRSMAQLHRDLLAEVGKDGVSAMDLLERQQNEIGRLAIMYGGPIML